MQSVDVSLRYVDDQNGLGFNDQFRFNSEADRATFEFDYVDGAKNKYDYKITTHFDNGMARAGECSRWRPGERRSPDGGRSTRNRTRAVTISSVDSRCLVRVIPTNEDLMIARHTNRLLFGR